MFFGTYYTYYFFTFTIKLYKFLNLISIICIICIIIFWFNSENQLQIGCTRYFELPRPFITDNGTTTKPGIDTGRRCAMARSLIGGGDGEGGDGEGSCCTGDVRDAGGSWRSGGSQNPSSSTTARTIHLY